MNAWVDAVMDSWSIEAPEPIEHPLDLGRARN